MKFSTFKTLVSKTVVCLDEQKGYIDSIPDDIAPAFYENKYVNSMSSLVDTIFEYLFAENWIDVSYFLYEDYPHKIKMGDGTEYVINNIEEYFEYAKDTMYFDPE